MVSNDVYSVNRTDFIDRIVEALRLDENLAQFFISFSEEQFLPEIEKIIDDLDCFENYSCLDKKVIAGYVLHCDQGDAWNVQTSLELEFDLVEGLRYKINTYTQKVKKK
ncbi:MAG: hypothetical protein ABIA37_05405 [Candidatus Woesearchaeota archaeon]